MVFFLQQGNNSSVAFSSRLCYIFVEKETVSWIRKNLAALFLRGLGQIYEFEPGWISYALILIGASIYYFGIHALRCLMTGKPFFEQRTKKKWQFHAANILFPMGVVIILAAMLLIPTKVIRDFLAILGLLLAFFSGCYLNIFAKELNYTSFC